MGRPLSIVASTILLHALNLLTLLFIRWDEPDTVVFAIFFGLYIVFTALVIHAYWLGQAWARWVIVGRCVLILSTFWFVGREGGIRRSQGLVERILAVALLLYLTMGRGGGWFRSGRDASLRVHSEQNR